MSPINLPNLSLPIPQSPMRPADLLNPYTLARLTPGGWAALCSRGKIRTAKHLSYLDRKLIDVAAGRIRRLIISFPPRHGKSERVSRSFPGWYLGQFPDRRIILASYASTLAEGFGRRVRDDLAEHGQEVWGKTIRKGLASAADWSFEGHPGGMLSVGVGGPLTGRGGDLIIDDPIENAEQARSPTTREKIWDWYKSTALTRLDPAGFVIVMATRWHADDLIGRLLKHGQELDPIPWTVINFPAVATEADVLGRQVGDALWPDRYPLEELKPYMADPYWWAALYQSDPTGEGGTEWAAEIFNHPQFWFDEWPKHMQIKILSLDPSKGRSDKEGDYSAFIKYGRVNGLEYFEGDLKRRSPDMIVDQGLEHIRTFGPDAFAIEGNTYQELFAPLFRRRAQELAIELPPILLLNNTVKKEVRIRRLTEPLTKRIARFKNNSPGTKLLVEQLQQFPTGEYDDGPDGAEMARRVGIKLVNEARR